MPSLTQLEYIVAIDRLRHFGKAAKACRVAQPTLSVQLLKAEAELGVTLFDRDKKPIVATDKGRPLIDQAKLVLRHHEQLVQMATRSAGELSGRYTLAIIPTLAPYLVSLFLERFTKLHPKVRLAIDERNTESCLEALRDDQVDAAVLATEAEGRGMTATPLFEEPFHLYLSPGHPLAKKKRIRAEDLDVGELWLLRDGHCFRDQVLALCAVETDERREIGNVRFDGGNFETLRNLIRAGRGYTVLPQLFIAQLSRAEREAVVRPFAKPVPTRTARLVMRREHWKADIANALVTAIEAGVPTDLRGGGPNAS